MEEAMAEEVAAEDRSSKAEAWDFLACYHYNICHLCCLTMAYLGGYSALLSEL
jgi:hypothetical protein